MESKYSFIHSYTLIAQTPLIHFQWRMKDATLRASEVKPKLDRFIIQSVEEKGDAVPEEWRTMKGATSLDYQMQIRRTASKDWIDIKKIKNYFASKADEEDKRIVFFDCQLDIICHKEDLAAYIHKNLRKFFILNVFGARQSKGFGGFLLKGTTAGEVHSEIKHAYGTFLYADTDETETMLQKLNHMFVLYTIMKNGINRTSYNKDRGEYLFPERYIKGYAVREFLPEDTGSDKAFLKAKVVKEKLQGGPKNEPAEYENYTFIRAMLGLANGYMFRKPDGSIAKIRFYSFDENTKEINQIEKFRSPVSIRLYKNRIYIFVEDTYKQMLGKNFVFLDEETFERYKRCKDMEDKIKICEDCPHLSTPKTFDPKKFLCGFAQYFEENKGKLQKFYQGNKADEFSGSAKLVLNVAEGAPADE